MRKILILLKVLILSTVILAQTSCFEDLTRTSIQLNTEYNHTISAFGTKYYSITILTSGNYTVSLTNCQTDLSWTLYDASGTELWDQDDSSSDGDEVYGTAIPAGKYKIDVEEWDDFSSSYTLEVYTGLPL